MGAEMGISTQKLHARGPMGLNELTCQKFIVLGEGRSATRARDPRCLQAELRREASCVWASWEGHLTRSTLATFGGRGDLLGLRSGSDHLCPRGAPASQGGGGGASALHRYEMVSLATVFTPYFTVSPSNSPGPGNPILWRRYGNFRRSPGRRRPCILWSGGCLPGDVQLADGPGVDWVGPGDRDGQARVAPDEVEQLLTAEQRGSWGIRPSGT